MDAIEVVITDNVIFPTHWIMQGMSASITPMAVQIKLRQGRSCSRQFKSLFAAKIATSVVSTFASATSNVAWFTCSSVVSAIA